MKHTISKLFLIIAVIFISSAYRFPEMLPDWENIQDFRMVNIHFGKSTVADFKTLVPRMNFSEEGVYTIFDEVVADDEYKSIRIGFRNNILDWIEFELKDKIKISNIIKIYGKPRNINTKYSKLYDYYDYSLFNFTVDKNHTYATAFSIFDIQETSDPKQKVVENLPQYDEFNFIRDFIPGQTLESDFLAKYPQFVAEKDEKADSSSVYNINESQLSSSKNYSNVKIIFKNNILNFVGLSPKNLYLKDITKNYGVAKKTNQAKDGFIFVEYPNFILVVNKKTQKVINVGIVSSF